MKTLELCKSNSIGNQYHEPTVIETWTNVPDDEAARLLEETRPNGYFVREMPADATGNN